MASEYDKLEVQDTETALKSKSMYMGSDVIEEFVTYLFRSGRLVASKVYISYRLWKLIDEIIVNAADRVVSTPHYSLKEGGPTTMVGITFDRDTGRITVSNNGQGFPVVPASYLKRNNKGFTAAMTNKWMPEVLCTSPHAGSNHQIHPDKVTGGINGIGIKGVIANCKEVEIETVDVVQGRWYRQVFHGLNNPEPPKVVEFGNDADYDRVEVEESMPVYEDNLSPDQKVPHTRFSFIPDYDNLCRESAGQTNKGWFQDPENRRNLADLIEARAYHLAGYLASLSYRYYESVRYEYKLPTKVSFNGNTIPIRSFEGYASLYEGIKSGMTIEFADKIRFPWKVYLGFTDTPSKSRTISLVNGIFLPEGGTHITNIQTQLMKELVPIISKKLKIKDEDLTESRQNDFWKYLTIIHSGFMPVAEFEGQIKSRVKINAKANSQIKNTYVITEDHAKAVWKAVGEDYIRNLLKKDAVDAAKEKAKTPMVRIRKYEPAEMVLTSPKTAGPSCQLACQEGDSAKLALDKILGTKSCIFTRKNTGTVSSQGVPPNILKNSTTIEDGEFPTIKPNAMLEKNETFKSIIAALNLRDDFHYWIMPIDPKRRDPKTWTPEEALKYEKLRAEGDVQFQTIRYQKGLYMFTDQDVDGRGQITSLVILYIIHKWPQLGLRNFCHTIETPLIRAYPKGNGTVKEFLSERDFDRWLEATYHGDLDKARRVYTFHYYKGLSQHSKEELTDIAENLQSYIRTITYDNECRRIYEVMYGKGVKARKLELMNPTIPDYDKLLMKEGVVPFSMHLLVETKSFQLDFFQRKLPSPLDGWIPVKRKAFASLRKMRTESKIRVFQLTGDTAKKMFYAHGDASMNSAITKMGQTCNGTNNIPPFLPCSIGFGGLRHGREVVGAPRYIDLQYNPLMNLLIPLEDDLLLPKVMEEGYDAEPKYYLPILPMAILETIITVAAGWNVNSWARDLDSVVMNVRHMIRHNYPDPVGAPSSLWGKPWLPPGTRCVVDNDSKQPTEYLLGTYKHVKPARGTEYIHVTQLPPKIWSYVHACYLLGLEDKITDPKKALKAKVANMKRGKVKEGEVVKGKKYVMQVFDNTDECVDMKIFMKSGMVEDLELMNENPNMSGVEYYLELFQRSNLANLNFVIPEGSVREFKSHKEILGYWFIMRRDLYIARIKYQTLVARYKVLYYENVLRYITEVFEGKISIKDREDADRYAILSRGGYVKFDTGKLFTKQYAQPEELEALILGETASYEYIDNIRDWDHGKNGKAKLELALAKARQELDALLATTWQDVWLSELDALVPKIKEGIAKSWTAAKRHYKRETVRE